MVCPCSGIRTHVYGQYCVLFFIKPITVFPVAITCGTSKPNDLEFLLETTQYLGHIMQHGFQYDDKTIQVTLNCIVCDAPARAMVMATKQYSGYYGCECCEQKGVWCGRVTYPDVVNMVLRTDQSVRQHTQEEHHRGVSPFRLLPVDIVKVFSIDYMHQTCQCVMRRLILLWIKGTRNIKLSDCQTDKVSAKLLALKVCMPNCFARKPRGLSEVERWKATEFREFMLYSGKLVLKGILRNDIYKHFMAFSVAMCILVSPRLIQMHKQYAQNLLVYFVTRGRELYVNEFVVYNVHAMLHIADDAEQFGNLDACAVFPFENYLQTIIRMVRSGNNVPVQVVKRISEQEITPRTTNSIKKSTVQLHKPNNAFLLEDSSCNSWITTT